MSNVKVIAEIGINHNGLVSRAAQLIELAAEAGVHAVKFQYRNLDNTYSDTVREIGDEILLNEIKKNYLTPVELISVTQHAKSLGLEAGISFFDEDDILDFGSDIADFDFFKMPSVELMNASLIDAFLKLDRHLYISLGAHSEHEIDEAFARLPADGWTPLHCISNYPLTLQNARLGYLRHLQKKWGREFGYSSHDDHWEVCLLAMQLGATVIERHITLDPTEEGLDHSSSSPAEDFQKLCLFADYQGVLNTGDGPRVPNQGELLNRQNLGRSYFAARDLHSGEILEPADLVYRSPNIGLNKTDVDEYLFNEIHHDVKKGASISGSVFSESLTLPENVVAFARQVGLSLPVRLHDLQNMESLFPIGAFEFHLSYGEVLSEIDLSGIDAANRYSIHLPDYVNSTQLIDPFSRDNDQKSSSLDIIERTVSLAERLQDLTGTEVPVVGSFSVVHTDIEEFHAEYAVLLKSYLERGIDVVPQWLPPIAWYFGGSVRLHAMNDLVDADLLVSNNLGVCLDMCHMILGRNYFDFSVDELLDKLQGHVRHVHIADAAGIDGEGLAVGEGEIDNLPLFKRAIEYDCLKVIEVWQGHFDNGAGFRKALIKMAELYDEG